MNRKFQNKKIVPAWTRSVLAGSVLIALIGTLLPETFAQENRPNAGRDNHDRRPGANRDNPETKPDHGWNNLEIRAIDGRNNNVQNPDWGSANSQLLRQVKADYENGSWAPAGYNRPNVRDISNTVAAQDKPIFNEKSASDFIWQWGQFIDHDIDLTEGADPLEPFHIQIPTGDPHFDPQSTGTQHMSLNRSAYDPATGTDSRNPRQQMNQNTAFIDASMVYGSDPVRAAALRANDGTGRLKTSPGNLLPFNTQGLPNQGGPAPTLFVAGDVRANEQVGLTAMHTLFMREHNRLADLMHANSPRLSEDAIYEAARIWVGALIQVITYKEFLPVLLGPNALRPYTGYKRGVNPDIGNEFSTAAYRVGHTLLSPVLLRLGKDGKSIREGHLPLREAFFAPGRLINEGGIDPLLRGLANNRAQRVDNYIIDDVRGFLFGLPGEGGFDLVSLNLQRGRDHGLASYNDARLAFGLSPAVSFDDITKNREVQERLEAAYGSVELVDLWMGGVSEDHRPGALVGNLFYTILVDQFERLRDGDRFFYLNGFPTFEIKKLEETTLADIIRRNTSIDREIQDNVFLVSQKDNRQRRR
ncbi:MAG TPA: peroxidase family protein [Nitrospirales bacterium]|nr:peroxidase family protein [Nitrospirales bacterium]